MSLIKQINAEYADSVIEVDSRFDYDMIVLHHTASAGEMKHLYGEAIDRMHRNGEREGYDKFIHGMGYHFLINPNGVIEVGERWIRQIYGAHCRGYNHHALGICMVGNFDNTLPTKFQLGSLGQLLLFVMPYPVWPHRKFHATDCPGTRLDWDKQIRPLMRIPENNFKDHMSSNS